MKWLVSFDPPISPSSVFPSFCTQTLLLQSGAFASSNQDPPSLSEMQIADFKLRKIKSLATGTKIGNWLLLSGVHPAGLYQLLFEHKLAHLLDNGALQIVHSHFVMLDLILVLTAADSNLLRNHVHDSISSASENEATPRRPCFDVHPDASCRLA